ncbi:TRC40/GET3/ArsA family transport-energizing ATPase [Pseudarthrobacter sp. LT1]|nr:TRC40/GET3/ArsA family transport-energizing ATPase [Pseudarthrobacter sp. LT1]WRT13399.1 TRC40/GET3/ArsA family transport-energizing ATPase [Pseudarthrobacter sp. LT1]
MKFLDNPPRFLFFTGKGGVGKTSVACAASLSLAREGRKVLLVSTDPASNIGQVFGLAIGNTITAIPQVPGLSALEIDPEQAADAYRERILAPVRGVLPGQELAGITESLSGSCTTEVASFDEFTSLLGDDASFAQYHHIVFDTAPTGHTIRLLQLPGSWTDSSLPARANRPAWDLCLDWTSTKRCMQRRSRRSRIPCAPGLSW